MTNHIALFEPRIHFNTGNIARTCAATNTQLHLIRPFGFEITDKHLKRAGLDYWDKVEITYHDDLPAFLAFVNADQHAKLHLITKFAEHDYSEDGLYTADAENHYFLFGREDTGLPEVFMRDNAEKALRIPMNDEHVRSLNLSNTAAIIIYECLRQQHYQGLELVHAYEKDKLK
ncbi:tRNA (cytidine(34)-2'-O)-methyltransferase [Lactococcus insecticola]|uniref:Putative tRNA (cytidine(34)-2'-O)-methyltransferase n=1 Tax=Pseudolactococcus insecticola TaxID=2709158 RepID=A0A6A0B5V6_9LACT|nr:tRNA (cytidine(34)-2'-O)-methyltransferase [Lactococcus insecticola]GFH40095.1 putative tRNA (cytidine(34)-2'-O)-methyltransferase [Lactococcus insecticola]